MPARTVTAILPNGRVAWLRVDPALSSAASVRHLGQEAEHAAHRRRVRARSQRAAIERLAQAVAADIDRLTDARVERADGLRRFIVEKQNARERKVSKAIAEFRGRVDKQIAIERESVRRLRRRALWDQIVIVSALPLFAAYGQRGRPFGQNNLALTLCLLVWLVGDELVDALFGTDKPSAYPVRDTDAWSYIAPIGNLLAGWWLMHDLQHERFVARFTNAFTLVQDAPDRQRHVAIVELSAFVAPGHYPDFKTYRNVPAVATISSIAWSEAALRVNAQVDGVHAAVTEGKLILTVVTRSARGEPVPGMVDALEVGWMIDTAQPGAFVA